MANRRKPKYLSAWLSEPQYAKLSAMATLRATTLNGMVCDLVDAVGVEIVMPGALNAHSTKNANDAGVRQDFASAVLS